MLFCWSHADTAAVHHTLLLSCAPKSVDMQINVTFAQLLLVAQLCYAQAKFELCTATRYALSKMLHSSCSACICHHVTMWPVVALHVQRPSCPTQVQAQLKYQYTFQGGIIEQFRSYMSGSSVLASAAVESVYVYAAVEP